MRWLWIVLKSALIGVATVAVAVLLIVTAIAYFRFGSEHAAGIGIGPIEVIPLPVVPLSIFLIAFAIAFIRFARR